MADPDHLDMALEMLASLTWDVGRLRRGLSPKLRADLCAHIERMYAAYKPDLSAAEQRRRLIETLDRAKADGSLSSLADGWLGDPELQPILARLVKAWANDKPGAKRTGTGEQGKLRVLSEFIAAGGGGRVSPSRLKKDRATSKRPRK